MTDYSIIYHELNDNIINIIDDIHDSCSDIKLPYHYEYYNYNNTCNMIFDIIDINNKYPKITLTFNMILEDIKKVKRAVEYENEDEPSFYRKDIIKFNKDDSLHKLVLNITDNVTITIIKSHNSYIYQSEYKEYIIYDTSNIKKIINKYFISSASLNISSGFIANCTRILDKQLPFINEIILL
jgi:hypothetical protein